MRLRQSLKFPEWFFAILNVPKIVRGHNAHLVTPNTDADILLAVVQKLSDRVPSLVADPSCWYVKRVELAIDFVQDEPAFSVERFHRFHSADAFDVRLIAREPGVDATCYLKRKSYLHRLYAKGSEVRAKNPGSDSWREVANNVRYEFVAEGATLKRKGLSNRLDGFCDGLRSGEVEKVTSQLAYTMIASVPPSGGAFVSFLGTRVRGVTFDNAVRYLEAVERVGAREAEAVLGMSVSTLARTRRTVDKHAMEFANLENLMIQVSSVLPRCYRLDEPPD